MKKRSRDDTYVYIYYDPKYQNGSEIIPFYIGKGTGDRWCDAVGHNYNPYLKNKINHLRNERGLKFKDFTKFEAENLTNEQAWQLEINLIKKWGRKDIKTGILLNCSEGGEGVRTGQPPKCLLISYKEEIFEMYYNGISLKEIANKFNAKNGTSVLWLLKIFNKPLRKNRGKSIMIQRKKRKCMASLLTHKDNIFKLYDEGKTLKEISKIYNQTNITPILSLFYYFNKPRRLPHKRKLNINLQ
jgi:hypothetical protein